jgi:DNA repair exonuclease SbcCD nuclease subunit
MAYRIAAERTANLPNVTWQMSDDFYQHFTIGRYRVLLVHGDEIRSYSGTPLFAIIKRVSAWAAGVVPTFDDAYLGHWHSPLSVTLGNGNRAFITGSPESGNVYAAEHLAAQSIPSQRLHFVDPEAGRVTAEFVIWLD